ncbi:conserved phage C-terminal domain-containing protein [Enterobacter sichuanensis]|uniref:conserved phage C-terminal domain-containing protein n=1 Tax=Enterobacter sichuanensis TaxID=2071710 RepID=UPI001AAF5970|nr:conserved phage C-terminal domain-containing protein [Enterobacter sichuanensis]MBO2913632.1 conserved phage C-terminal domain-containing protein [Enterobacter sichuanensis]MBO2934026.1 conserved phage C-terminal domain-containing protein [Enterobacter sichuanensis]
MSSKLHGLVWECDIQPISRKAVIARLADFCSDEGYCWPAVDTIRRQVGAKSKNTVTTAIKELEKEGWVTVIPRKAGGRDLSNGYQLNVEKIELEANHCRQLTKQAREERSGKFNPSNINPSKPDTSKNEESKKVILRGQNLDGMGSSVDPDPSLKPTTDPSDKKPSCQVAQQPDDESVGKKPDPEVLLTDNSKSVLKHLNQVSGSRFQNCSASLDNIRARLREGFTPEELMLVVDYKHEHWKGLEDYQYMRPKTLFTPGKFPSYLQIATRWNAKGRPKREDWDAARKNNSLTFGGPDKAIPAGFRGAKP